MSVSQKDWLSRWAPYILLAITNAVSFGVFYQKATGEWEASRERDAQIRSEMMPLPERIKFFGTRESSEAATRALGLRLESLETVAHDISQKVDYLYRQRIDRPNE